MTRMIRAVLGCSLLAGPACAVDRLDPRDFDTSVGACVDVYQFANGGWLKATPVPPGEERINQFTALAQQTSQQRLSLMQTLLTAPADTPADRAMNALVRSLLDPPSQSAAATVALDALLGVLPAASDKTQLAAVIAGLHARGLPVLFRLASDGKRRMLVQADLLGLPDPDFYLNQEPAAREWLGRYRGYVETVLTLTGSQDVATESAWALDFEARIAQAMQTSSPGLQFSARKLSKQYPHLPLKQIINDLKLGNISEFSVQGDATLAAADKLLATAHPVQWRAWLRFRVGHLLAPWLGGQLRDAHDRFLRVGLGGETLPNSADLRALEDLQALLGDAFAQRYSDTYLSSERRQRVEHLVSALRQQLAAGIQSNSRWDAPTRAAAQSKLDGLTVEIVQPSPPPDLSALALNPANLVGNVLAIARWRIARAASGAETSALPAAPLLPQLGYQHERNRLLLTPALLQPPLFDQQAEPALQFAGLGSLIAHELSHGFDLGGAGYGPDGQPDPWWSESDRGNYQLSQLPLVAHYSARVAIGDQKVNGERVLAESAADLSGLNLAWKAFSAHHDTASPLTDGLSPSQRFFVGWASLWRENALESERIADANTANQAPPAVRASAPLAYLPGFATAFACPANSPMLQAPGPVQPWP